jgi:hypothetical protein
MTKKKERKVKKIKAPVYRTKEERQEESKTIIRTLTNLQLSINSPAIKSLFEKLREYITDGHRTLINIPFPEMNRRIRGVLADNKNEEVWIRLEYEEQDNP